jgi:hypothetical protein
MRSDGLSGREDTIRHSHPPDDAWELSLTTGPPTGVHPIESFRDARISDKTAVNELIRSTLDL